MRVVLPLIGMMISLIKGVPSESNYTACNVHIIKNASLGVGVKITTLILTIK